MREDENSLNENETGSLSLESGKDGRNPTWLVVFSVLLGLAAAGGGYLLYRKIKKDRYILFIVRSTNCQEYKMINAINHIKLHL